MVRLLLTGVPGTGKSTLIEALARRGHRAIEADSADWCHWVRQTDGAAEDPPPLVDPFEQYDWVWREDRIGALLSTEGPSPLFVGGVASNQAKFYDRFDHIVLLSLPSEMLVRRLAERTSNDYGKSAIETDRVIGFHARFDQMLRDAGAVALDVSGSVDEAITQLLLVASTSDEDRRPELAAPSPKPGSPARQG